MRTTRFLFIGAICPILMLLAAAGLAADSAGLFDAVKRRDHKALRALLAARAEVNVAQPDGATPLAWAIHLDDLEAAELLLAAGALAPARGAAGALGLAPLRRLGQVSYAWYLWHWPVLLLGAISAAVLLGVLVLLVDAKALLI